MEVKQVEEKIINKLRNNKRKVEKVYKMIKNCVDIETDVIDSETLKQLQLLAEISEEMTDIIYLVIDNKNS